MTQDKNTFDRSILLDRIGGNEEIFNEIIKAFLKDAPRQISALREALTRQDAEVIQRQAHTLNGASGNIGAPALQQVSYRMEISGKEGDLEQAKSQLEQIDVEFERLREILTETACFL